MRKLLLVALLALWSAPALSQACPPVSALADSERRVAYAPSASTGPFSLTFALYGDSTDYGAWVEVWLNGARLTAVTDWQLTIPSGSLSTACRPITNASITLTNAATGTLQIVGARRPRRASQFGQTAPARDLNVAISDLTAQLRESWDKTNDVTGRALIGPPGDTVLPMPPAAQRANRFLHFDPTGTIPQMLAGGAGSGNVIGPATTTPGHFAIWADSVGTQLGDAAGITLSTSEGGTGGVSWTPNLPLIGNGTGPLIQGTVSGNTTKFATTFGALTTDQCVKVDASGNFVVAGATCGASANAPNKQYFATPSGTTVTLTSLPLPTSADLLDIYFDGVLQDRNTWSLVVGTGVVTFAAAIPANVQQASAYWFAPSTLSGIGSITVGASVLTGAINLLAGTGISLTPAGQNITVANTVAPPPGGRLTLQSGHAVQLADQTNKSTIYYTCTGQNPPYVPVPNGTGFESLLIAGCEISTGLSGSFVGNGNAYDLFIVKNSGAAALCYGSQNWTTGSRTSNTVSHGAQVIHNTLGYWTNSSTITNCYTGGAGATNLGPIAADTALYVGSFLASGNGFTSMAPRPTAALGGNNTWCGLYNAYNQIMIGCKSQDATPEWTTTSAGPAVACNAAATGSGLNNRVNFVDGLAIKQWVSQVWISVGAASSTLFASGIEVALDGLIASGGGGNGQVVEQVGASTPSNNFSFSEHSHYDPYPTVGKHFLQCLESGANSYYFGNDFMKMWVDVYM